MRIGIRVGSSEDQRMRFILNIIWLVLAGFWLFLA